MAHTLLSRFYAYVLRKESDAAVNFVSACKALAAFYTLWRSAYSNAGLDDVYRQVLRGSEDIRPLSWHRNRDNFTIDYLRIYLRSILESEKRNIGTKEAWKNKAQQYFRFNNAKPVCRFAMFLTATDTIPDKSIPGLMISGKRDSTPNYLTPSMWRSKDLRTLEHIAPQKPSSDSDWDTMLYEENHHQAVGNLTLLPVEINSSASNQGWKTKWIYYRHLAETDPDNLEKLADIAEQHNVSLEEDTIDMLRNSSHKSHMLPIVELGIEGQWNLEKVQARTERICNILWDRVHPWLE